MPRGGAALLAAWFGHKFKETLWGAFEDCSLRLLRLTTKNAGLGATVGEMGMREGINGEELGFDCPFCARNAVEGDDELVFGWC